MSLPEIILYMVPGTCALVPHILLNQAGLKYRLEPVADRFKPEFTSINPKQQVPVLIVDGEVITEVAAISQAINQLVPEAKLFGETPLQFIRVCEWLNYFSAAIHAQAWGPYLRPQRFTIDLSAEAGVKKASEQKLKDRFALIESRLPEEGWILGTIEFTAADAYLLPFWQWMGLRKEFDMEEMYPKWASLMQRLQSMEAVKKTLEEVEGVRREHGIGV